MGFNYGLEKRKFTEEWKKLYSEYSESAGILSPVSGKAEKSE